MRNAFAAALEAVAASDPRVVLLSGDIGNRLFDGFKARWPERFYNCGVAEANLVSVAAGMALCGLRPMGYTIAAFMTTRCYEQIRVDVCYHKLPVILVGTGAGLSYANNGPTHQSTEDLAILRALPGMTIVCPGDASEVGPALSAALALDGPVYLRLGKKGEPRVHDAPPAVTLGEPLAVRAGEQVCLLACGTVLPLALAAADQLAAGGLSTAVFSHHTVKPLCEPFLADAFTRYRVVATVEEHSVIGGLGSAVAEWLAERERPAARFCRCAVPDEFLHAAGDQHYYRQQFGLTPEAISARVRATCRAYPGGNK